MGSEYINENVDCNKPPKDGLIKYGPKVVEELRKEFNLDNKENRGRAIAIIDDWIKQQDHFMKKDFSIDYIERCLLTCKGSIERTKIQIDRMCTFRTLMPKYFQITDIANSDLIHCFDTADYAITPQLTDEYYRVILIKLKLNAVLTTNHYTIVYKLFAIMGEYFKGNDYCRGYILVSDFYDTSASELIYKINPVELQQFLPVLTEGYGIKIKGIYIITASKMIENFLKMFKQLFSAKIASRIEAFSSRIELKSVINGDVLPEEYGGPEKSMAELHKDILTSLSGEPVQALLEEMNKAVTDESKRQTHQFNDQYMGMPGTFRTLNLD